MALLLVFMLTTLFFYMVYTMHYDSASDDFTGFTVFDYQSEPGAQASTELGTLREDLDDWARQNQAVVFTRAFRLPELPLWTMRDGSKEPGIRPLMAGKPRPPSSKKEAETCTPI